MDAPGWLSQRQADVPPGKEWLGDRELTALAGLRVAPRRAAWRLGRWTAKAALGAWLQVAPSSVEVIAAADGAPEAWIGGARAPVSVSLSHRSGRALAVVTDAPRVAGCDIELIEPRSGAFVREWLAAQEQRLILASDEPQRALLANLIWTAKEAAAKVRREGLRLDVRRAVVTVQDIASESGPWRPLEVYWDDRQRPTSGWWRAEPGSVTEPGWVMVVAGESPTDVPRELPLAQRGAR